MTAPSAQPAGRTGLGARLREVAGYVAPTTVLASLLLYFGYIGTRARFEYFGVSLELLDLSNQDLTLYGLEVIYVPAALVMLSVLVAVIVHAAVSWALGRPDGTWWAWVAAGLSAVGGVLLVARGLLGVLVKPITEKELPGVTGLCLAIGPALLVYGAWIALRAAPGGPFREWAAGPRARRLRIGAITGAAGLFLIGTFWAANSFAWVYGQGRGYEDALNLTKRPEVVLDSKYRLAAPQAGPGVVGEQTLAKGNEFRFRYWRLRLLTESGGRLFLVPARWRAGSGTLVVPYDDDVRMRFVPGPP